MSDRFTHRIISHISDRRYRAQGPGELAKELSVEPQDLEEFRRTVQGLIEKGQLVVGAAETVALPPPGREMTGSFRLNERGFGFVIPESAVEHGDLFVPPGSTGGAQTGDRVRARVRHTPGRASGGRSPYMGVVVEIIQRAERRYVGNLVKRGSHFFVECDGRLMHQPVSIRDPEAKNAKVGDKVVIELISYPSENATAQGVITEVLGEQGEPDVETRGVMRAYGLPERFDEPVLADARAAAQSFSDVAVPPDREDLTGELTVTIDPPDAKDYDDAISIARLLPAGTEPVEGVPAWELGVHIADVSHFVKIDSAMDVEAKKRGNSAYLPRRVVPMLPEVLSNGVCSLQEGVNRLCKSAFIRYDAFGKVLGQRYANTVIRSAKRMTYLEAQALIDGDLREARRHAKTEPRYPTKITHALKDMNELSKVIRARRLGEGMIVLGLPDVELVFDQTGRVVDAQPEDNAYTHTLIEMFMVEANEAAARLFNSLDVPMIRRIHPDPEAHDITELRMFARVAGYNIPSSPSRKELQALLDGVRDKPAQHAVHLAVLKTLAKAEYSPLLIGHFALASEHYTHFTSPIRRYADLMVHRGLDAFFAATGGGGARREIPTGRQAKEVGSHMRADERCPAEQVQADLGRQISGTERNAESAERDLRTYLVLDLLSEHLGEDFEGTVTGVTGGGVFMQLNRYLVDGFVRADDLPGQSDDRWQLNKNTGALVAQRSGRTITIGDRFIVRVAKVNPVVRQMDLVIISDIRTPTKGDAAPGAALGKAPTVTGGRPSRAGASKVIHPLSPPAANVSGGSDVGASKARKHSMRIKRQRRDNRKKKR
ncbi:MAG: VacB/RNase II family 3'-5' exoribonuclease [Planctomycetota bacterium]|nr:VacB/RNase II family 3'-5' exoribonuclease [Planctomycetota bacterium]